MKFRHSLRFRIVIAFCLFGAVLGTIYATAVYISLDLIDDHLVNQRLQREIEYFLDRLAIGENDLKPTSPYISAYVGTEAVPEHFRKLVGGMPEGLHEIYLQGEEYHVTVQAVPQLIEPLYLLYKVSALEFTENRKLSIAVVLCAGIVLIVGLGLWIGLMISRQVIAPVTHLAEQVSRSEPTDLPANMASIYYDDEVGVLARSLSNSMQRIKAFVDREQQFARDASHELRTPVTVIKGAVEILSQKEATANPSLQKPLERIERATTNMENIIQNLLVLAREEATTKRDQTCKVHTVIKEIIENQHMHFPGRSVEIESIFEGDPELNASPVILKMVVVNLIQNAFQHTTSSKVSVHICDHHITITDMGEGIAACDLETITEAHKRGEKSQSFGLGLSIVKRLCQRFNWQFDIKSQTGRGTTARLTFHPT